MLAMDHIEASTLASLSLGEGDIVVIGAYKGDTVAFLREHHPDKFIIAYEPQIWAYNELHKRFALDTKVKAFPYGLGAGSRSDVLLHEYGTDAASILELENWRTVDTVELLDARVLTFDLETNTEPSINHNGVQFSGKIALCVMNIEGYEYTLIPYILNYNIKPTEWLIQFHFTEKFADELFAIRDSLAIEHSYMGTTIGKGWELWSKV